MSEQQKTYTEREVVERERKAFVTGALWRAGVVGVPTTEQIARAAAHALPLPKITRPRVERDPVSRDSVSWKVEGGYLLMRHQSDRADSGWMSWGTFRREVESAPLPGRVKLWADLLANPTETVEEAPDV